MDCTQKIMEDFMKQYKHYTKLYLIPRIERLTEQCSVSMQSAATDKLVFNIRTRCVPAFVSFLKCLTGFSKPLLVTVVQKQVK